MGKTTYIFRRMKFQLPQILLFYAKTYAASRESKVELLMLVSDLVVNSTLKNTQRYFCGMHGKS